MSECDGELGTEQKLSNLIGTRFGQQLRILIDWKHLAPVGSDIDMGKSVASEQGGADPFLRMFEVRAKVLKRLNSLFQSSCSLLGLEAQRDDDEVPMASMLARIAPLIFSGYKRRIVSEALKVLSTPHIGRPRVTHISAFHASLTYRPSMSRPLRSPIRTDPKSKSTDFSLSNLTLQATCTILSALFILYFVFFIAHSTAAFPLRTTVWLTGTVLEGDRTIVGQLLQELDRQGHRQRRLSGQQWWTTKLIGEDCQDVGGGFRDVVRMSPSSTMFDCLSLCAPICHSHAASHLSYVSQAAHLLP